jgi:hypothetical protein
VKKLLLLMFALLVSVGLTCSAQETTAAVQGTVTDPSGAAVAGAIITASSPVLGTPAKVTTDSHGFYRVNALPPGIYTLVVAGQGMKTTATDLRLNAGDLPELNLKLTAAGTDTTINVTDSIATVDTTQSKVETTIDKEIFDALPKGRSFQSLLTYAPGVRQEALQSLAPINGTSAPNAAGNANIGGNGSRQNGFQTDGASDSENLYMMDGVNITNIQGGGIGFNIPFEFSQDISVKSSGIPAEFGGALGGVVNVIPERGTSSWHGSVYMNYRSSAMNANDQCAVSAVCNLRIDPALPGANSSTRTDGTAQYYVARQDHYRYVDPGFTVGGPLGTDKLLLFASYSPSYQRTRRDAASTFAGNAGAHTYYQSSDQHLAYGRLDYAPTGKLRVFGGWDYNYIRITGQLPNPDSKTGQLNSSATSNPATFRPDGGFVNPGAIYSAGVDYTLTSRTLITARYGYMFNNVHTLGAASGLRYLYTGAATSSTGAVLTGPSQGTTIPVAYQNPSTFSNIAANQPTFYNAYKRKQLSFDLSHLASGLFGTHNFKGGYSFTRTGNDVKTLYDFANVTLYYGQSYSEGVPGSCDAIKTLNQSTYGLLNSPANPSALYQCRGNYGYFIVHDGTDVLGADRSNAHGLYVQDDWTVGHTGLTINAGVRFDKEFLPPYAAGDPSIDFPWTSKVAPRIGGAYAFHNGTAKIFASYGKFYDILKFSLPQGSFGGNYWHDCVYTLDNPNYNTIIPTAPAGPDGFRHSCPVTGMAPGVSANPVTDLTAAGGANGRFIENLDLRAVNNSTNDPGVDPNIKPTAQHEFTFGAEWAVKPTLSLKARYVRKRLDSTTEDIGLNDTFGFYIGNPGTAFADVLHRALPHVYDQAVNSLGKTPASQQGYLSPTGICPQCPAQPAAIREYDAVEFRVEKRSSRYFITAFYTYSDLRGNYPGLTSTYITDGSGGRHNPNNNRSFDLPNMQFTAYGKPYGGKLPTDRPHAVNFFGSYLLKTFAGDTRFGLSQILTSGSPVSTCLPAGGASTSACQFVEDQGNFVNFSRDATGNLVNNSVTKGRRTPFLTETGINLNHYVRVSKDHENRRFGGEFNVTNLLNQHAVEGYNDLPITTAVSIAQTATPSNPTGTNYAALLGGFDYVGVSNGVSSTGSTGAKIFSNQYGLPNLYQTARQMRIKLMYQF